MVLRAAEQIARYGWLKDRPVTTTTGNTELGALSELRTSTPSTAGQDAVAPRDSSETLRSLLSVARGGSGSKSTQARLPVEAALATDSDVTLRRLDSGRTASCKTTGWADVE